VAARHRSTYHPDLMKLTDPEMIAEVTRSWHGDRDHHGRPLVADSILARLRTVTTEQAWTVLNRHGYENCFVGEWTILHPEQILVGRAITCRWVPLRPDLHDLILRQGEAEGRIGFPNSWVIDEMVDGDVLVADLFGEVNLVGDNLTAAIIANGGRGMVIDGGLRDLQRIQSFPNFCTYVRRIHPEGIPGVTMPQINGMTRIGGATCMPGDIVLGTPVGVIFIPPHLAEAVIAYSNTNQDGGEPNAGSQ
jgi:regulator of RNase E activity RraA